MQHVEVTRRFAAPPRAVWDVYTDHAGWEEWAGVGRSRLSRQGEPDRNGVGAIRVLGPAPLAAYEEVVEFDPPKYLSYRVLRGGIPVRNHLGQVRFEADGEGTRVVWSCRFESRVPLMGGVFERVVTRVFRQALDGLAKHAFPD